MHEYDKSSKWLIEHHGDAILRLAGVKGIAWWRALQAELVQPRRLPDGLLEVQLEGESEADLYLLEIATRLEPRLSDQVTDDVMLVWLDRAVLPEVITLVLRPRGKQRTPSRRQLRSRHGLTRCSVAWHVVELWTVPGEELFRANDVGLVPWIPLTFVPGPPEVVLQRCRDIIDDQAPPDEHVKLLAVTQVLAGLRYNEPGLFDILGEKSMLEQVMRESWVVQEFAKKLANEKLAQARRQDILTFLEGRFGTIPAQLAAELGTVTEEERLLELIRIAARCPDLESFQAQLRG
ncbi:MAG: hypothetical protein ACREJB_01200 [Planctomycetaceae bacterium]